jgi:CRISPR system Cascade subunit CasC
VFIEVHLIQNFAPSCLNRDDTNAPKDCEFGGYRRARISSQCIKRAVRRQFRSDGMLPPEALARRTKRLVEELVRHVSAAGKEGPEARGVVEAAVKGAGLGVKDDGKTEYLLFLGEQEVAAFGRLILAHYEALCGAEKQRQQGAEKAPPAGPAEEEAAQGEKPAPARKKTAKDRKKEAKEAVPTEFKKAAAALLDGGKAADLALFGRMLADMPDKNIVAACQVAHALSTNRVSMEIDYYTAVDDLKPEDTAGADMIGTVEFNSSCFYRYANIDFGRLTENLQGDGELAGRTVEAFLRAAVEAIPTGKQCGTAAHNPPEFVFVVVRERGLWSLANAFVQPARPSAERSLVQESVARLDGYWRRLVSGYGGEGILARPAFVLEEAGAPDGERRLLGALKDSQVGSLGELISLVMTHVRGNGVPREATA